MQQLALNFSNNGVLRVMVDNWSWFKSADIFTLQMQMYIFFVQNKLLYAFKIDASFMSNSSTVIIQTVHVISIIVTERVYITKRMKHGR